MIKSHRGSAKRFMRRGKSFKRGRAGKRHLLEHKASSRLRGLRGTVSLTASQHKKAVELCLGA